MAVVVVHKETGEFFGLVQNRKYKDFRWCCLMISEYLSRA